MIPFPQGRVLGGSSALNAQAFIAPSEVGINFWRDLGNPGWDWETMLPYYEKSHTVNAPSQDICNHLGLNYLQSSKWATRFGTVPNPQSHLDY